MVPPTVNTAAAETLLTSKILTHTYYGTSTTNSVEL